MILQNRINELVDLIIYGNENGFDINLIHNYQKQLAELIRQQYVYRQLNKLNKPLITSV